MEAKKWFNFLLASLEKFGIISPMLILLSGQVDTSAIRYTQAMNFVFQVIFTVIGVFLSVVLTRLLVQKGRFLKEMRNLRGRMDKRSEKWKTVF